MKKAAGIAASVDSAPPDSLATVLLAYSDLYDFSSHQGLLRSGDVCAMPLLRARQLKRQPELQIKLKAAEMLFSINSGSTAKARRCSPHFFRRK